MLINIWFFLWGLLWAIYFMLDGFDLGLGTLQPLLAKTEDEKKLFYKAVAPYWDGNEVWLITAGGVTIAAFPRTYAVLFSAFYTPLMLVLFALILRAVALEFRHQVLSDKWRAVWDRVFVVASFLPGLLLGVAFANIFKGIPIDGEGVFHGTLLNLLSPYGLLGGLLFALLFCLHGAIWFSIKTEGELQTRAATLAKRLWPAVTVALAAFVVLSLPVTKLFANYFANPVLFLIPVVAVAGLVLSRVYLAKAGYWQAFVANCLTIVGATFFGVAGLYPNLLPSSFSDAYSLTVVNSSSSPLTLKIMLGVALVFVPIVICYQAWTYWFFSGRLSHEDESY